MNDEVFSSDLMVPSVESLQKMIDYRPSIGDKRFIPSYRKIMQKISSLIAFTYSGIPQPYGAGSLKTLEGTLEIPFYQFHREFYFRYQSIRLNTRSFTEGGNDIAIRFFKSQSPGIYYPFVRFFGTDSGSAESRERYGMKLDQFRNEGVEGSSFATIERTWNDCVRFIRLPTTNLRPTLEGFTETYRAIREGELPNRRFVGLLPINYVRQSVVSEAGTATTGVIRAVGEAYPDGLDDNQLLVLQKNSRMTYSKGSPSTAYGYVFKLDDSDAYAIMKIGTSPSIKIYSTWNYLKNDLRMLRTSRDTAWWAKGNSVFEFEFGGRGIEIGSFNYGVDNFLLRQNT